MPVHVEDSCVSLAVLSAAGIKRSGDSLVHPPDACESAWVWFCPPVQSTRSATAVAGRLRVCMGVVLSPVQSTRLATAGAIAISISRLYNAGFELLEVALLM